MSRAWAAVLLSGLGTFGMRASFLTIAHRMVQIPPLAQRMLRQIPPAAMASLTVPAILRHDGHLDLLDARVGIGLLAAAVAWRTRSTGLTLLVGLGGLTLVNLA
ncbi:MAG: AzlD domain-containing protein [Acidimicrobiia bacterium]